MSNVHPSFSPSTPVYIAPCDAYETEVLIDAVCRSFDALGIGREDFAKKKVVIKPNLVMKKGCDGAATTHPAVLSALLSVLDTYDCQSVVIAESGGGPYTEGALRGFYSVCGIEDAVRGHKATLNYDVSAGVLSAPNGLICKQFESIRPIMDADVIINLCKLKSHSLTRMSAAIKNTFGTIPGLTKFEYHARFPDYTDFNRMLVDLSEMLHRHAFMIDLCDAVIGMEGNGPTGGVPRKIGALLVSQNPFNLDTVASAMLSCEHEVTMVAEAAERGFCPRNSADVPVLGCNWKSLIIDDFAAPDSTVTSKSPLHWLPKLAGGTIYRWFSPRPMIRTKTCIGCGECERSCPVHTIRIKRDKNGKKKAYILPNDCIRCFCCQELCPIHSIDIKKNPILYFLSKMRK